MKKNEEVRIEECLTETIWIMIKY